MVAWKLSRLSGFLVTLRRYNQQFVKKITVRRFTQNDVALWDDFIRNSRNGTFLFFRGYMDYHSDRFQDHSLLFFADESLMAVLPAHLEPDGLHSHRGLSYGGFVYGIDMKLGVFTEVFASAMEFLDGLGITSLFIKEIPDIFHLLPSQEQSYAFFLAQAELLRCDALSVVDRKNPLPLPSRRMASVRKAISMDVHLAESEDFEGFWNQLLIPHMSARYQKKPVHTLEEILLLKSRFPQKIRLFTALSDGRIVAGCVIYETETTAHMQYISSEEGQKGQSAMDFLRYQLIMETFSHKRYFNYGPSQINEGLNLQESILFWKESFGARTVVQRLYKVDTSKYERLKNVLV